MIMKDSFLQRPVSLRTVLLLQIIAGALFIIIVMGLSSNDAGFSIGPHDPDARRLIVCNAPARVEPFSIELAGCQVMHCTESISGSKNYRQLEFFIC